MPLLKIPLSSGEVELDDETNLQPGVNFWVYQRLASSTVTA
jgi:hypothetical protein